MAEKQVELPQKLNFFVSAFTSIMGFALAGEIFEEDDVPDKIDDILFLLLGIAAIWWYKKHPTSKSLAPVLFVVVGAVIKFAAILVEFKDAEAVGDDIGIFIGMVIALVVVIYQYRKLK